MGLFDKLKAQIITNNNDEDLDLDTIESAPKSQHSAVYNYGQPRNTNACPNCGFVFEPAPARGRKCPECHKPFVVRRNQSLFNSDLLTEEQATDSFCFIQLESAGATIDDAIDTINKLKKQWNKTKINPRDVLYSLVMTIPQKYQSDPLKMIETAADCYHTWAKREYNAGKDPRPYLETSNDQRLELVKLQRATWFNEVAEYAYIYSNHCCDTCRSRNGKRVKITDAKTKKPLPFKDCTNRPDKTKKYSFCEAVYYMDKID